jgi:signal transduction histidine kinase
VALYEINWLTLLWGMVAACLLTLAAINLVLAARLHGTEARGHLLFAAIAISAAATGGVELLLAHAQTTDLYGSLLLAVHIPIGIMVLAIPWFVLLLFRAGRPWLAIASNVVWAAALIVNVLSPSSRIYASITSIERIPAIGGGEFSWATGVPHPLRWVGQAGVLLVLAFVVDSAIELWKRGEIRRAAVVGGCLAASVALGLSHSALVSAGRLQSPYLVSLFFLFIVGGMAYELVHDAVQASVLERRVHVQQAEVAHLSKKTMLGEVSGGVAHELSQPLNAILNNAESAISFLDRDPPDLMEVRDALVEIAEQDRHACEVVGGFARLAQQGDRRSALVNVNGVVGEVLGLAQKDLDRNGIELSAELDPTSPRVRGDPVLVSVIVLNLVRNAIEAMSASNENEPRLTVKTVVTDRVTEVIVTDRGSGIPKPERERIFDPFFTTREQGSGLGLAVSQTLAELHGGSITADAGPGGRGTSMRLRLPSF